MLHPYTDRAQPASYMTDRRWETRLLALLAAVLVVRAHRSVRRVQPFDDGRRAGGLGVRAAPGARRPGRRHYRDAARALELSAVAALRLADARGRGVAARGRAAAVHPRHRAHDQRRAALGESGHRHPAAVRARQVRGRGLDGDARGEEGRADPHLPTWPVAVPRDPRARGRVDLPRAEPVHGVARRDPRRRRALHGGGPGRTLPPASRRGGWTPVTL